MDHNIPDVIRAIYLDFAFCARRLISCRIISALYSTMVTVIRVNSLEILKAWEHVHIGCGFKGFVHE